MDENKSVDEFKVRQFMDATAATNALYKPILNLVKWVLAFAFVCVIILGLLLGYFIHQAYSHPIEVGQEQNYSDQVQSQNYTSGATNGG